MDEATKQLDKKGLKIGDCFILKKPIKLKQNNSNSATLLVDLVAFPNEEFMIIDFTNDLTTTSTMPNFKASKEINLLIEVGHGNTRLSTKLNFETFCEYFGYTNKN